MLRAGFGCTVLANDITDFSDFYAEHGVQPVNLEALLARSDVVSLHLPFDPSTKNILNAERLASMKPGAVLINTARGGLVDEVILKTQLEERALGGAAFDVFAVEPPEDTAILQLSNFLVTPHIGGSAEEAIVAMGRAAIEGLDNSTIPVPGVFPPGRW